MASYAPHENGNANGNGDAYAHDEQGASFEAAGGAGPSSATAGYPHVNGHAAPLSSRHDEGTVNYLYEVGFQTGQFADTVMHVHQNIYRLHAILLARSPYLAHLLATSPHNGAERVIYVPLEREPEITPEGFAIALGYLYSSVTLKMIHPGNARAVLAAGCLLGGMPEFCEYAYEACRHSITLDTIAPWLDFLTATSGSAHPVGSSAPGSGVSTPISPTGPPPPSIFGIYAERLRSDVFQFLVSALPSILGVAPGTTTPSSEEGRQTLLDVFARVPFDLFKSAVESPDFRIGSDQSRFKFAKDAIELRKRTQQGSGIEETVVLAFGGSSGGGSAVHITRKMRKRPLWKVNA